MSEALFQRRVPEAAARQMAIVLMSLLECQFATLEGLPRSTSAYQRRRHESICDTYVRQLVDLDIPEETLGLRGCRCPRVAEAMRAIRSAL